MKNLLSNIYKTSKGAIKGIIEEFKEDNDIEKLLSQLDLQINISIQNTNDISNGNKIVINNDNSNQNSNQNLNTIENTNTKNEIAFIQISEEYKKELNEIFDSKEIINEVISSASKSILGITYNGFTVNTLKNEFMNNVKIEFGNRLLSELVKRNIIIDQSKLEIYIETFKTQNYISTNLKAVAEKFFYDNYLSQYNF